MPIRMTFSEGMTKDGDESSTMEYKKARIWKL